MKDTDSVICKHYLQTFVSNRLVNKGPAKGYMQTTASYELKSVKRSRTHDFFVILLCSMSLRNSVQAFVFAHVRLG